MEVRPDPIPTTSAKQTLTQPLLKKTPLDFITSYILNRHSITHIVTAGVGTFAVAAIFPQDSNKWGPNAGDFFAVSGLFSAFVTSPLAPALPNSTVAPTVLYGIAQATFMNIETLNFSSTSWLNRGAFFSGIAISCVAQIALKKFVLFLFPLSSNAESINEEFGALAVREIRESAHQYGQAEQSLVPAWGPGEVRTLQPLGRVVTQVVTEQNEQHTLVSSSIRQRVTMTTANGGQQTTETKRWSSLLSWGSETKNSYTGGTSSSAAQDGGPVIEEVEE